MTPLFRWDGQYWGFISNGHIFNSNGEYRGWIENDGRAWREDVAYLGVVVENNYILPNTMNLDPIPRIPRIPPIPPIPPIPSINRIGRIGKISYEDPLEQYT